MSRLVAVLAAATLTVATVVAVTAPTPARPGSRPAAAAVVVLEPVPPRPTPVRVTRSLRRHPIPRPPAPRPRTSVSPHRAAPRLLAPAGLDWDAVARCESGGDWHANTGNAYFGGLQMDRAFWSDWGGLAYAARPDLATRLEQITVATRAYRRRGSSPWPVCGRYL